MKKLERRILAGIFFLLFLAKPGLTGDFSAGMNMGYYCGAGLQFYFSADNFTRDFPLTARLGMGYSLCNPGNAASARKIFINDATNGTPQKDGGITYIQFDLIFPIRKKGLGSRLYVGPRYSHFKGNFKFIGGNEFFDITSNQWGMGAGLESLFTISSRVKFLLGGGLEYFTKSSLQGHDTVYAPDGENINSRNDYTYSDADAAINQPGLEFRLMLGLQYHL
ncbi:MAG: hypothetical protein D6732_28525 [Methanobacteriota archaeon]|nr:MAG: hypothetical protein D6732_28525 [Euryarchaeota archaeon]